MQGAVGAARADRSRESGLASMGQMFRRLLEMHGLDAIQIARRAGVDLARIPAPAERIAVDKIDAMLRVAIPLIREPAFGLQAARCWHLGDGEAIDALEVQVFARAYTDAWRALYLCEPTGEHTVESLGLTIDFGRHVRRIQ